MAEDMGAIIVDTQIDAKGFEKGVNGIRRALNSLDTKISGLGPTFQKAMQGNSSAIQSFNGKAQLLNRTISTIEQQMKSLATAKMPTEEYEYARGLMEKTEKELDKLLEKQIQMDNRSKGSYQKSTAWQNIQADIELTRTKLATYKAEVEELERSGEAYMYGADTGLFEGLEEALQNSRQELAMMQAQVGDTVDEMERIDAANERLNAMQESVDAGKRKFKSLGETIKSVFGRAMTPVFNRGVENQVKKLTKRLTGLFGQIGTRIKRALVSGIYNGMKEGVNNLARFSPTLNGALSSMKSALTQLKNSFGAAFAPIITTVVPHLVTLINYVSAAVTSIGQFIATLLGQKTFIRAVAVQEDYAGALEGTAAAAKEAKRQLAGFDELNILSKDGSGGGSGGSAVSPSEMFEEVDIDNGISEFGRRIREAILDENWEDVGGILVEKLNEAIGKVKDFLSDTNFKAIGTGIGSGITGAVRGLAWDDLGKTISKGVKGALDLANGLIQNIDWRDLGKGIWTLVENIEWADVFSGFSELIGSIIGAELSLVKGFIEKPWGELVDWWHEVAFEDGEFTIEGLLEGIWKALKNIYKWIKKHIFEPFINGFKKAFGIDESQSKEMKKMGEDLIEGLKLGLGNIWEKVKGAFEELKNNIIAFFQDPIGTIKIAIDSGVSKAKEIWDGFKSGTVVKTLKETGSRAISVASSVWNSIVDGTVVKTLSGKVTDAFSTVKTVFNNLVSDTAVKTLSGAVTNAWTSVKTAFNNLVSNTAVKTLSGAVTTAWTSVKTAFNNLTSNSAIKTISGAVSSAWTSVKDAYNRVRSETVIKTLKTMGESAVKTAKGLWDSIVSGTVKKVLNIVFGTGAQENQKTYEKIQNKTAKVTVDAEKSTKFNSTKSAYDDIKDKSVSVSVNASLSGSGSSAINKIYGAASGGIISSGGLFRAFASGGKIMNSGRANWWNGIQKYASGTAKAHGTMFVAGEAGPEIVGHVNGRTEILNKSQIAQAIYSAMVAAGAMLLNGITKVFAKPMEITISGDLLSGVNAVSYRAPYTAGNVLPYEIQARQGTADIVGAIEETNDELMDLIVNAISAQTASILQAMDRIRNNQGRAQSMSASELVAEINQQTRMYNASPLMI